MIKEKLTVINPKEQNRELQLCVGDLLDSSSDNDADFIVISAFPNDYSKTPGSIIDALCKKGIDVAELSKNRDTAFDPKDLCCWISKPFTLGSKSRRLICFEVSNMKNDAQNQIEHIFICLKIFCNLIGYKNKELKISIPMICTGSGKADLNNIFYSLFYESVSLMSLNDYNFSQVKLVCYSDTQYLEIYNDFIKYKNNYIGYNNKRCSINSTSFPMLTDGQIYGINDYTGSAYLEINSTMRSDEINKENYKSLMPEIVAIKSGLENLPFDPRETYRGESDREYNQNPIFLKSFTSSSKNPCKAFNGGVIINIDGKTCKDVQKLSKFPSEEEYLYGPTYMLRTINPQPEIPNNKYCYKELIYDKNFKLS